jgi:hypothetical protein
MCRYGPHSSCWFVEHRGGKERKKEEAATWQLHDYPMRTPMRTCSPTEEEEVEGGREANGRMSMRACSWAGLSFVDVQVFIYFCFLFFLLSMRACSWAGLSFVDVQVYYYYYYVCKCTGVFRTRGKRHTHTTRTQAHTHTHTHTHTQHARTHARTHIHINTHSLSLQRKCTGEFWTHEKTLLHTHTNTHAYIYSHAHTHTNTHAYIYSHAHTHTHTHAYIYSHARAHTQRKCTGVFRTREKTLGSFKPLLFVYTPRCTYTHTYTHTHTPSSPSPQGFICAGENKFYIGNMFIYCV